MSRRFAPLWLRRAYHAASRIRAVRNENMMFLGVKMRALLRMTQLYRATGRLPILTATGRPGLYPFVGIFGLVAINAGVLLLWSMEMAERGGESDEEIAGNTFMGRHFMCSLRSATERPWTLLTSAFSHMAPAHFAGNMFALTLFGWRVWRSIGAPAFLGLYVWGGMAASVAHVGWSWWRGAVKPPPDAATLKKLVSETRKREPDLTEEQAQNRVRHVVMRETDIPALGASGSVMAVAGAAAVLFFFDNIRFRAASVPVALAVAMYAISDAVAITNPDGVAHTAHLGGAVFGVAYVAARRGYLHVVTRRHLARLASESHVNLAGRTLSPAMLNRLPTRMQSLDLTGAHVTRFDTAMIAQYPALETLRIDDLSVSSPLSGWLLRWLRPRRDATTWIDLSTLAAANPKLHSISALDVPGELRGTLRVSPSLPPRLGRAAMPSSASLATRARGPENALRSLVFSGISARLSDDFDLQAAVESLDELVINCGGDDTRSRDADGARVAVFVSAPRDWRMCRLELDVPFDVVLNLPLASSVLHSLRLGPTIAPASSMILKRDDGVAGVWYPPTLTDLRIARPVWWNAHCAQHIKTLWIDLTDMPATFLATLNLRGCTRLTKLTLQGATVEMWQALNGAFPHVPRALQTVVLVDCVPVLRSLAMRLHDVAVLTQDSEDATDPDSFH